MYTDRNFKTKKAFREAVEAGKAVRLYSPGLGFPCENGRESVEGPQNAPHTWYAEVTMKNGLVIKVK